MESTDLPKGWFKEEVIRKSGLSAGKTDIYYHGPDGKKYRSKPQIARELGDGCDLSAFDFKSGRMMNQSGIVRRAKGKKTAYDFSKNAVRNSANLTLPVRQTASIFKQPVTVIRSHPDSQVRHDLKHGNPDAMQPRQLFWEKSLSDLKFGGVEEKDLNSIVLPSKVKGIGPELSTENLLQSIAAALHLNTHPIVGQSQSTTKFAKNPTVHINTNQPLVQQLVITDDDIKQQEGKVVNARKKVEELLAAIEKSNRESLLRGDRPLSAVSSESGSEAPAVITSNKTRKRKASPSRSQEETEATQLTGETTTKQSKPEQEVELQESEGAVTAGAASPVPTVDTNTLPVTAQPTTEHTDSSSEKVTPSEGISAVDAEAKSDTSEAKVDEEATESSAVPAASEETESMDTN